MTLYKLNFFDITFHKFLLELWQFWSLHLFWDKLLLLMKNYEWVCLMLGQTAGTAMTSGWKMPFRLLYWRWRRALKDRWRKITSRSASVTRMDLGGWSQNKWKTIWLKRSVDWLRLGMTDMLSSWWLAGLVALSQLHCSLLFDSVVNLLAFKWLNKTKRHDQTRAVEHLSTCLDPVSTFDSCVASCLGDGAVLLVVNE